MDSQIFKEQLQRSKPIRLKSYLYHWKTLGVEVRWTLESSKSDCNGQNPLD
jgi:hypothetical protein